MAARMRVTSLMVWGPGQGGRNLPGRIAASNLDVKSGKRKAPTGGGVVDVARLSDGKPNVSHGSPPSGLLQQPHLAHLVAAARVAGPGSGVQVRVSLPPAVAAAGTSNSTGSNGLARDRWTSWPS